MVSRLCCCESAQEIVRYHESEVVAVISKTGYGKSFVVQALGNAARRKLIPVRHTRLADICDGLNRACVAQDGSHFEKMDACKSVALLLVDDFMTTPILTQNSIPRKDHR